MNGICKTSFEDECDSWVDRQASNGAQGGGRGGAIRHQCSIKMARCKQTDAVQSTQAPALLFKCRRPLESQPSVPAAPLSAPAPQIPYMRGAQNDTSGRYGPGDIQRGHDGAMAVIFRVVFPALLVTTAALLTRFWWRTPTVPRPGWLPSDEHYMVDAQAGAAAAQKAAQDREAAAAAAAAAAVESGLAGAPKPLAPKEPFEYLIDEGVIGPNWQLLSVCGLLVAFALQTVNMRIGCGFAAFFYMGSMGYGYMAWRAGARKASPQAAIALQHFACSLLVFRHGAAKCRGSQSQTAVLHICRCMGTKPTCDSNGFFNLHSASPSPQLLHANICLSPTSAPPPHPLPPGPAVLVRGDHGHHVPHHVGPLLCSQARRGPQLAAGAAAADVLPLRRLLPARLLGAGEKRSGGRHGAGHACARHALGSHFWVRS